MKEVEVKIVPLPWAKAHELLRGKAERQGAFLIETLYFDRDGELKESGRVLRLRVKRPLKEGSGSSVGVGKATLGFKRTLSDRGLSIYEEHEVEVSSKEEAQALLLGLGYKVVSVVRKEREVWRYRGATITLERILSHPCVPEYGEVEVMGNADALPSIIESLGFHRVGKLMAINTHQLIDLFCSQ